jgi:hypothetical protein
MSTFNYLQVDGPLTPPSSDKVLPSQQDDDLFIDSLSSLGEALVPAPNTSTSTTFPLMNSLVEEDLIKESEILDSEKGAWYPGMSIETRKERRDWLMESRGVSDD